MRSVVRRLDTVGVPTTLLLAAVVVGCAYGPWVQAGATSVRGVDLSTRGVVVIDAGVAAGLLGFLYTITSWRALWLAVAATGVVAEAAAYGERAYLSRLHSLDLAGWALKVDLAAPALLVLAALLFGALGPDARINTLGLPRSRPASRTAAPPAERIDRAALVPNDALAKAIAESAYFVAGPEQHGTSGPAR